MNLVLADQAFVSGMHFLIGILLARYLGMTGYGEYILAYGVILFFSTWQLNLIISPMMMKLPLVQDREKDLYFWALLILQLLLNVVVLVLLLIIVKLSAIIFVSLRLERILWATAAAIVFFLTQDFFRRYFFATNRPGAALINDIYSYGLQMLFFVLLINFRHLDAIVALWVLAGTSAIASMAALVQLSVWRMRPLPSRTIVIEKLWQHLHFGKWLLGGEILYWIQNQFVNYFCAGVQSIALVGAMNAARNVTGVVNVLFLGLMNFLPPRAARVYGRGRTAALTSYLVLVSFWGGLATLAITLVASIGREFWLNLFYGQMYAGYGWLVIWWSIYYFIGFFLRPLGVGLSIFDRTRSVFISNLIGFSTMIIIIYPILSIWQIQGLMFVLCLNNSTVLANLFFRYRKAAAGSIMGTKVARLVNIDYKTCGRQDA